MANLHKAEWKAVALNPALYQTDDILGDTGGLLSLEVYEPSKIKSNKYNKSLDTTTEAQRILQQLQANGNDTVDTVDTIEKQHTTPKRKKKQLDKSKHKKQKLKPLNDTTTITSQSTDTIDTTTAEHSAWHTLGLHTTLCTALIQCNFTAPTNIQQQCIPAAALYYKHVVAASATGTGKTLAFILPILQRYIVQLYKQCNDDVENIDIAEHKNTDLFALIITPTRELAIQIVEHTNRILSQLPTNIQQCIGKSMAVVGGINAAKQHRLLSYKPAIVVGTPGRLWDIINATNHTAVTYMQSYYKLQFIVLDEVDRLIAVNAYTELQNIIQYISKQRSNTLNHVDSIDDEFVSSHDTVKLSNKKLEAVDDNDQPIDYTKSSDNTEDVIIDDDSSDESVADKPDVSKLQIMCFSATLNLNATERTQHKKHSKYNYEILNELNKYIVFDSKPHLVNLSTHSDTTHSDTKTPIDSDRTDLIPSTLTELKIQCTTENKDYYLYYFLLTHPGKYIIFVNSISCIRRLYSILSILQYNVYQLHANMQQKQRLKQLEQFKKNTNAVIISTDVAARGIDIPSVDYVLQYQLARTAEIYVHRAGRTARNHATGTAIALISEIDQTIYNKLTALHKRTINDVTIDNNIFTQSVKRMNIVLKIDALQHKLNNTAHSKNWLHKQATELDIAVDSDNEDTINEQKHTNKQIQQQITALKHELHTMCQQSVHTAIKRKFHTHEAHTLLNQQLQIQFKFN